MSVVSSNFDGSENPLSEGGIWESGIGTWVDMQKIDGAARGTAPAFPSNAARLAPSYLTVGPNQFSRIVLEATGADFPTACTRMAAATANCYMAEVNGGSTVEVIRCDDDVLNVLGAGFTISPSLIAGDAVMLVTIDLPSGLTEHRLYVRDVYQGSRFDSTYATGQPGVRTEGTGSEAGILSWTGGDWTGTIINTDHGDFPNPKIREAALRGEL